MAIQQAPAHSWLETRLPLYANWRAAAREYRVARDQPYLATLPGIILGALIFLAVSGAVLSVYYVAAQGSAFDSIQFIERSVAFGWLINGFHATGTTMIFAAVYLLLFRAMLTGSYRGAGDLAWFLKLKLFILLLLTGWLGYAMTDGAVSYWSLRNTALAGSRLNGFPGAIANWIFGGPAGPGTLGRLAVLHVVLALLIFGVIAAILISNRAVVPAPAPARRPVAVHPYHSAQYFVAFVVFALIFAVLVFFAPHLGSNLLNAMPGDPLVVPSNLTGPWYLLPLATIGGLLPTTYGAIIGVLAALAVLYALPWLDRGRPGLPPRFLQKLFVWILALDVIALCVTAGAPPSSATPVLEGAFILWYFLHFLVLTPLTTGAV